MMKSIIGKNTEFDIQWVIKLEKSLNGNNEMLSNGAYIMIIKWKYWRVICRYGHVGRKKEISVARYIRTDTDCNLIDVLQIVSQMPGVKKSESIMHSIVQAKPINKEQYEQGKESEKQNLYIQNYLMFRQTDENTK